MKQRKARINRARVLQKAIDSQGCASLAAACGVTTNAIYQWEKAPSKHVLTIERITGVSRYELRPDIFGNAPEVAA